MTVNGEKVSQVLGFRASAMRSAAVKAGERLLAADLNVQLLRAAEASAWTRRGLEAGQSRNEDLLAAVRTRIVSAQCPVRHALDEVANCDKEILALATPFLKASSKLVAARAEFERERSMIETSARDAPAALALDMKAEAFEKRAHDAAIWAEEGGDTCNRIVSGFEKDPVFLYLLNRGHGTGKRISGWFPFRSLDRWLAKATKHDMAYGAYLAAKDYPEDAARWAKECIVAAREFREMAESERCAMREPLADARERLASHLNDHSRIDGSIFDLSARRRDAMSTLATAAADGLPAWNALSLKISETLAMAKKNALSRPAVLPQSDRDLQDDAIELMAEQRKRLSKAAEAMRAVLGRCTATERILEELRHSMTVRQWDGRQSSFSLPSIEGFMEDLTEGRLGFDGAWKALQAARVAPMPRAA